MFTLRRIKTSKQTLLNLVLFKSKDYGNLFSYY